MILSSNWHTVLGMPLGHPSKQRKRCSEDVHVPIRDTLICNTVQRAAAHCAAKTAPDNLTHIATNAKTVCHGRRQRDASLDRKGRRPIAVTTMIK